MIAAVDLFCGIGGLTKGMENVGINVVAGIDIEKECEYAYTQNTDASFIQADIKNVSAKDIIELYPEDSIKLLMGCAPCQPFSSYSYRYKKTGIHNSKLDLLSYFADLVEKSQPDLVSMENVPQLAVEDVFQDFTKRLKDLGYKCNHKIVYSPEYGVPQNRKRLLFLASKYGPINFINPIYDDESNFPTVRETIYDLPPLTNGACSAADPLHKCVKLNKKNMKRIQQSSPGGSWKDWDKDLQLDCHKKKSGRSYLSNYGRMEWDKPAPTITTQFYGYGNGRFGHPEQDRAISYREGFMLQTFPADYKLLPPNSNISYRQLGIQIGNAVPVKLAEAIGKSILLHIEEIGK